MSPALAALLAQADDETEPGRARSNRGRLLAGALAEAGFDLSIREANKLIGGRVDDIAAHIGMSRAHLLRHYIDQEWVLAFARSTIRGLLEYERIYGPLANDD